MLVYKAGELMAKKKLLVWLLVSAGLFGLICGCYNGSVDINDGGTLYRAKCSSCHNIIAPSSHNKEQWYLYVNKYGKKMTEHEKQAVLDYLAGRN